MRALFAAYALGVVCWLLLGLLPLLSEFAAVHGLLEWAAARGGPLGAAAARILQVGSASAMPGMPVAAAPPGPALLQYLFSLLNLTLGLLLFLRRPDDLVPRLLAFGLLGTAATFNLPSHRAFALIGAPWPIQLLHFTVHVASGVAYLWAVVLFPDGSWPRQIPLGRAATRWLVVAVTVVVAVISWRASFLAHPQFFMIFFGIAIPVLGVGTQVLRIRDPSAPAEQRAVARLLCAALLPSLAVAALWLGGRAVATGGGAGGAVVALAVQTWFPAVFAIVPVVLVAGVLRYRLWDIDRLLSRVLVYTVVVLGVGTGYVLAVSAAAIWGTNELWTTVAVLTVVAVAIEPFRTAARRWAHRVVFGQDLDPAEAARVLAAGLERLDAGREIDQLADVALRSTRAQTVAVWLAEGDGWVRLATAGRADGSVTPDRRSSWPIHYDGATIGLLTLLADDGNRLSAADRRTADRIAGHAGLVLHNATLTVRLVDRVADLAARSAELRRARRRLVAAQDEERHRIERDLHDGAQQALVAAVIGAAASRPPLDADTRAELMEVLQTADRDLEQTLHGSRPAALDEGLPAAIRGAADLVARTGPRVTVHATGAASVDPEVEVAVYYCCVEALQNAAKHAAARRVTVELALEPTVSFVVADDGTGLDPTAGPDRSGGLLQLGSRLSLLGGSLTVEQPTAGGTAIRGWVPARVPSRAAVTGAGVSTAAAPMAGAPTAGAPMAGASG